MIIREVSLKHFKKFEAETFQLPGHVVFAGPNNSGKTTVLQAIAAFSLAFDRWRAQNDFQRHNGAYTRVPIVRQVFSAVPLRNFDLLWSRRSDASPIEITLAPTSGLPITMELAASSTEQIWVRPLPNRAPDELRAAQFRAVYAPAMSGLTVDEPVYQKPKIEQLLGHGRPGEVLRNLLVEAKNSAAWPKLHDGIERLFGYDLRVPNDEGADIIAEYADRAGKTYDILSAGSGFLQVLMLLTFLHVRPGSVLLVDEPDAHLHMILQDAIYGELRRIAAASNSQLVIATHSEVIINSVDPAELCVLLNKPRMLTDVAERAKIVTALEVLSATDILEAIELDGVLYLEGWTDLAILKEFARILGHAALTTLETRVFWRPNPLQQRDSGHGVHAREHFEALTLVRPDLTGLEMVDGDADKGKASTPITGTGLQRLRWERYEIESYLVHPTVLARFVEKKIGTADAPAHVAALNKYLTAELPPAVITDPLGDHPFLRSTKARRDILPPALGAAGLPEFPYTSYSEIAAVMQPDEIPAEVKQKLDLLQKAFGL
ncbi:MAG: ATP-dependent nuclease [Myxococcales bacterium]